MVFLSVASAPFQGCVPRTFGPSASRESAAVSPRQASSPKRALSPLDISFLFPLESAKFKFPLSEGPAAPGKTLITEETYDSLGAFLAKKDAGLRPGGFGGGPPTVVPYEYPNFRVVAFRFDPCGGEKIPTDLDIKGCGQPLIRLVAQPMVGDETRDQAMHLIYRFQRSQTEELLAGLEALKTQGEKLTGETTDGKPIGIHPSLKALDFRSKSPGTAATAEANSVLFANAARDFVLRWCGKDNLFVVATMVGGFRGGSQVNRWNFRSNLIEGGVVRHLPVTGVDQTTVVSDFEKPPFLEQSFLSNVESSNSYGLSPVLSKDMQAYISLQENHIESPKLTKSDKFPEGDPTEFLALKKRALVEAARIENPQAVKVTDGDCVSCHVSTRVLLKSFDNTKYSLDRKMDQPAIKAVSFVPPASVAGMEKLAAEDLENKLDGNMVLNFGYREKIISISQRTANETAELIALVNSMVKK